MYINIYECVNVFVSQIEFMTCGYTLTHTHTHINMQYVSEREGNCWGWASRLATLLKIVLHNGQSVAWRVVCCCYCCCYCSCSCSCMACACHLPQMVAWLSFNMLCSVVYSMFYFNLQLGSWTALQITFAARFIVLPN